MDQRPGPALFGFQGADWEYFVGELAKYGVAVVGGWMFTGEIYEKCKAQGLVRHPRTTVVESYSRVR